MPKHLAVSKRRIFAVLATVSLVVQSILPSSFLGVSPAQAATSTWDFTTAGNYTLGTGATVGDTYALSNLDLTAASDGLDSFPATSDLIETTAGRILAGLDGTWTYPPPYSTDYGDNWNQATVAPGAQINSIKFAQTDTDRIIGAGFTSSSGGGWCISDDDGASWSGHAVIAGSTKWGAAYFDSLNSWTWVGTDDADDEIYISTDNGGNFARDGENAAPAQGNLSGAVYIHDIIRAGSTIYAAATISAATTTTTSIFYTIDDGANWTQATKASSSTQDTVYRLAVDSSNYVYGVTSGAYILKSTTASGTTFSEVAISGSTNARSIYIDGNDGIILPGTSGGIYRSFDSGSDFIAEVHGSAITDIVYANAIIRMSDYTYLLGTENDSDLGNAYSGTFNNTADETTGSVVTTKSGVNGMEFVSISGFTGSSPATSEAITAKYRITNDDDQAAWYYWDSSNWVASSSLAQTNTATEIDTNIGQFHTDVGSGTFHVQTYLTNTGAGHSNSSVAIDSITVTYIAGTITVDSPTLGQLWYVGKSGDISWTYSNGYDPSSVDISYSIDAGSNWTTIISGYTVGTSYSWNPIPPAAESETAKIKVASGAASGESAEFMIRNNVGDFTDDNTPPYSWVEQLPSLDYFTLTSQFEVRVEAYDEVGGSGLKTVSLYFCSWWDFGGGVESCDGISTILWDTWDIQDPDATPMVEGKVIFNFDTEDLKAWGDGNYAFFSTATDFAGNDNNDIKNIKLDPPPPCSKPPCNWTSPPPLDPEAYTTVDSTMPWLVSSDPGDGTDNWPINTKKIELIFSEPMNTESLVYELHDRNGYTVPTTVQSWTNNDITLELRIQEKLQYNTIYKLDFTLNDVVGHKLDDYIEFMTRPEIHPDITVSTIEVTDGPNKDGTYSPGDLATYTITLRNASERDPAENMSAELRFAQGVTYQNGSLSLQDPYGGMVTLIEENGVPIGFDWSGMLPKDAMDPGEVVVITYSAHVNNPADVMVIEQNIDIYDEVHFRHSDNSPFNPEPATIYVAEHPNFSPSIKTVDKTEAYIGDTLNYTISVTNASTAQTSSSVKVTDLIPTHTSYVNGSLIGDGNWASLEYSGNSITAIANALAPGSTYKFYFSVTINGGANGQTITNTAVITNLSGSVDPIERTAQTFVHPPPPDHPPEIWYQSPSGADGQNQNVPLQSSIEVSFTKTINITTFTYSVKIGQDIQDTSDWSVEWESNHKFVTITPPVNPESGTRLEMGTTYTVDIDCKDTFGLPLKKDGSLPSPWSFTTADPIVQIITPEEALVEIGVNKISPEFIIKLQDTISGKPYKVESGSVDIALRSNSSTGRFGLSPDGFGGSIDHVTIGKDKSRASFYYIDSRVSSPGNYTTISVFENPSRGWADSDKYVVITSEDEDLADKLTIWMGSNRIYTNTFSEPIIVKAFEDGKQTSLPSTLYFYTQSAYGAFYDSDFNILPEWMTAQSTGTPDRLQYATIPFGDRAPIFYYIDASTGTPIITVADNVPLLPDTDFDNAGAVLRIVAIEEELEEELEEVEDDTGRVLEQVVIDPTETVLLPGGIQVFNATGYDTENEEIENLIFRWYAIGGGGTIEKEGLDSNSHRSAFEAGRQLGVFYDTVLVATLYNGEIGYATATVVVADIVDYGGPARLPTTGISTLQMIFMALTLAAAVALAWVTSYEKTHFADSKK